MSHTITTYEPDNSLKKGYWGVLIEIFLEIRKNKWLIYQLSKRNLLALYKQSFMGFLWVIFIPFISIGAFIIMNRSGILDFGIVDVPYPLFALVGLAFWQIFSSGIVACSSSLVNAGPMIVKINFSKKSLVIASLAQSIITFILHLILACILLIIYGFTPDLSILLLPVLTIPLVLFTLGLGFIFSLLNSIVRDIGNTISVIVTFLLFLTPVLYTKPESGIIMTMAKYNPLYYLTSVPRDLILDGNITEMQGFLYSSFFALSLFLICLIAFHLTETRVAERV